MAIVSHRSYNNMQFSAKSQTIAVLFLRAHSFDGHVVAYVDICEGLTAAIDNNRTAAYRASYVQAGQDRGYARA
jgi:hypothetical protein